jgi:transcriptional regulator with XRE-family HTH domain
MQDKQSSVGELIQTWRRQRRRSQLDLSIDAGISQRHLSFVETGRSVPSREIVLTLAEHLEVPPRERNVLLVAAGYAPLYRDRGIDHPDLAAARLAVEAILAGHMPNPALAIDRHWNLELANRAAEAMMAGVDPSLLGGRPNVLRLSLHPLGLAGRIRNFRDWRAHVVSRLHRQLDAVADPVLADLLDELKAYPFPSGARPQRHSSSEGFGGIAVPLALSAPDGTVLSFISTTTIFGTAVDIGLSELAIESFFPTDDETRRFLELLSV